MGIMTLGSLWMTTIFTYKKYGKPKQILNPSEDFFSPEKRLRAIAKRSLSIAKTEVSKLHVQSIMKHEEIVAPDGTDVLVLKVAAKFE